MSSFRRSQGDSRNTWCPQAAQRKQANCACYYYLLTFMKKRALLSVFENAENSSEVSNDQILIFRG